MVLNVGPKKTRFVVHKRQLCELSPFFEAAFNGKFQEKAGTMDLVDDDVHAFEHFVQWVYERNVGIPLEGQKMTKSSRVGCASLLTSISLPINMTFPF